MYKAHIEIDSTRILNAFNKPRFAREGELKGVKLKRVVRIDATDKAQALRLAKKWLKKHKLVSTSIKIKKAA